MTANGKEQANQQWNQGLDIARGIAVLLVVYSHGLPLLANSEIWQALNHYTGLHIFFKPGWWGVRIFFALSGYLIGRQAITVLSKGGLQGAVMFTLRRWTRTVPTYWILLAITCSWLGVNWFSPTAIANATFVQTATLTKGNSSLIEVAWSLVIEEWSYAVIAAVLLGCAWLNVKAGIKQAAYLLLALAAVSWIWSLTARGGAAQLNWLDWELLKKTANLQLDSLAAGCVLASMEVLWPHHFRSLTSHPRRVLLIAATGMSALGWWLNAVFGPNAQPQAVHWLQLGTIGYTLCNIAACLFICGLWKLRDEHMPPWLSKPLHFYAKTSYSLYLVHFPIAIAIQRSWSSENSDGLFAIYFVVATLVGTAFWYCFERPFVALRKQLRVRG